LSVRHDSSIQLESPDPQIRNIQPGSGICMRIELAWGHLRRAYLKTFRRGYVQRMQELRTGQCNGCPQEILDPRDLKYYQNVCGYQWSPSDDPFTWRDRLPLVRAGLAEAIMISVVMAVLSVLSYWLWKPLVVVPLVLWFFLIWFFRDPKRTVPADPNTIVSPADGVVVAIDEIEDDFVGPAWMVGIFLSVFNVHLNRTPAETILVGQTYRPGKFLNALRPESARENERLELRLQMPEAPHYRFRVRQIAGAIARRIVCWVRIGQRMQRGEKFGMIKVGSRTELVLPRNPNVQLVVRMGQKVKAGSSVMARFDSNTPTQDGSTS
jgi:phosphatidylserine decarboxylase